MQIHRIPVLSDNYIFLLHDAEQNLAAVVDPAEAQPVLQLLEKLGASLSAIFNTHHHSDHVGGNLALLRQFPQTTIYGGAEDRGRIPGQQVFLQQGDQVSFGGRLAEVLFVPGHTRAHIAYYFAPVADVASVTDVISEPAGELFCGDTLFAGGCGRLFEGTPSQMVESLSHLRALPDQTRVWCAHEYTLKNLQFALTVDRQNLALQDRVEQVKQARQRAEATVPTWLGVEKQTNPFLRWDAAPLQAATQSLDPVRGFAKLRGLRDMF
ncbi:MAG: hydroxyacylglutathione hydrolase [Pegethrix bostrychoides GSE-TBD4-15B]|jgi:hydroxyacylglutathione hydrolase|uniref:Hydroxyacylglutathione hydrolase n=1 Tax=Pegethrix bostrychoides GSE-TBD4-15B TaxID=2839662 RepID=A0A951PFK7_9CYAN|nr:hydroxyacylglutathione hydrolase [Pegethrix bostrychoides GSE-TBD4-15B]